MHCAEGGLVEAVRCQPRDLGRAEAGGQDQADAIRRIGAIRERIGRPRAGRGASFRRQIGRGEQRASVRRGAAGELGQARSVGLPPVAPERNLRVSGLLPLGLPPRGRVEQQVKGLGRERLHRLAVEVASGVDVHLVLQQLMPARGGGELERRDEGEIRDRAIPGDEEEEIAPGADLTGDALKVIARAVHEMETGLPHGLGVVDDRLDARARVLLVHRAERLEDDVVQAAELVAGRRIRLGRDPMPREALLERLDFAQQRAGGREVAHIAQDVALAADQLIRLAQIAGAAVADHLVHERARERVAGDARERVGAPALQGDFQGADRGRRARGGIDRAQPAAHQPLALGQTRRERAVEREEGMRDRVERVAVRAHEGLQPRVVHRLGAVVEREDRADIRVHDEAGHRAQNFQRIIGFVGSAPFRVRNGHDPVDAGVHARERLQPRRELPGGARGARGGAEDDHTVARADPASSRAHITLKGPRIRDQRHGRAGLERRLVEREGQDAILEIGLGRQREREPAHLERLEHRAIAQVVARRERGERPAKRLAPRTQLLACRDSPHGEAVALEHGVTQRPGLAARLNRGSRLQLPDRNRHIIRRRREARDGGKGNRGSGLHEENDLTTMDSNDRSAESLTTDYTDGTDGIRFRSLKSV